MATVIGPVLTTNVHSDYIALEFGDQISLLDPNQNPFTLFTRMAGKEKTGSKKYSHFEDRRSARFDTLDEAGGVTTTATQFTVDHGAYFAQWDLWQVTRTGEVFRVDAVATNELTVTRNIAPTGVGTGVAMIDADELMKVGEVQPENDTAKVPRTDISTKVENFCQIIRKPFELSDRARASVYQLSPNAWDREVRLKGIDHAVDIEAALVFGKKSTTTPGSAEATTTGGVLAHITFNQTDAGGDLSEAEYNAWAATLFTTGGSAKKLVLASATAIGAFNKFPAAKQQVTSNEKTYGMVVTTYTTPFGEFKLVHHKLLTGAKYGGYAIAVDMANVKYRFLGNGEMQRDTKLLVQRQAPSQDGRMDEYLTDCGAQIKMAETHGLLSGITS